MEIDHLIDNEATNQNNIVQYLEEMEFEEDLIGSSVKYAVASEKFSHVFKNEGFGNG